MMSAKTNQIKNQYNRLARELKNYETERWHKRLLSRISFGQTKLSLRRVLENDGENLSVLEIGCGSGVWSKLLLNRAKSLTLLDISRGMLDQAQRKLSNFKNITFVEADFLKYQTKKKFDHICAIRVFEYFPDKKIALKEMYDLLNKNGKVIIVTKNPVFIMKKISDFFHYHIQNKKIIKFLEKGCRFLKSYGDVLQQEWISPKDLEDIMKKNNFRNIHIYPTTGLFVNKLPRKYWIFVESYIITAKK